MGANKIKKNVTVIFFKIDAKDEYFDNFSLNYNTISDLDEHVRVITHRDRKHLVRMDNFSISDEIKTFSATIVRERNTWQIKATRDGVISGINLNQGIIGDPYFITIIPSMRIVYGFTSGPSGTIKSVCRFMLDQLNTDRKNKIKLDLIPREKEYSALNKIPEFDSIHFKMNSSHLNDLTDDAPTFFKELASTPLIGPGMQLSFDLAFNDESYNQITKENVVEIVNFLSDLDGCSGLKVKGKDAEGNPLNMDFSNSFINYKTEINTRNKFIDEDTSLRVLKSAMQELTKFKLD
ncbi:hypothetical protein PMI39_020115 [Pantoea sp. YR343]|uniref:hypothetical protein n=1 Tax=Pantoea sp. YR343 TaxID=1144341 RepID=UPI000270D8CD|nr:hypothetical protein [Pantoea sp. YR343]KAJ9430795.1 hypothetical protein PMI39_020115 [Pantoea sp. YR343]